MPKLAVRFNGDGSTRIIDVSDQMLVQLAIHGANQKSNDSYVQKDKNGKAKYPTAEDKKARWDSVLSEIEAGNWSQRDSGNPEETLATELVTKALREKQGLRGKELEKAVETFMDDESNYAKAIDLARKELARRKSATAGLLD